MVDRKIKALFIYLVSCDGSCEIINSILVQTCLVSKDKGKSRVFRVQLNIYMNSFQILPNYKYCINVAFRTFVMKICFESTFEIKIHEFNEVKLIYIACKTKNNFFMWNREKLEYLTMKK